MRGSRAILLLALGATLSTPGSSRTGELTFQARVEAQRAIERVYYSHQIGNSRPFEKAVPESLLERKVRTYLKQSAALENFWGTPLSAAALHSEWQRIARSSRFPERLEEIYAALGHDSVLIQETFARSVLVDRLSRRFFKTDERIHSRSRREIEALHERLMTGALPVDSEEPHRTVWEVVRTGNDTARQDSPGKGEPREGVRILKVGDEELERWRGSAPSRVGEIGGIQDEEDAWSIHVLLGEENGALRIARYAVPRIRWDDWWQETRGEWEEGSVATVAQPIEAPRSSRISLEDTCIDADTWDNGILDAAPRPATGHTAVWTGSLMVVWGGTSDQTPTGLGARYDPLTDTWSPTSNAGAPSLRSDATAVWTGQQMIVWGGAPIDPPLPTAGGLYDPVSDTWQTMSTSGAPAGRFGHTAVWTGTVMVIWGGGGGSPIAPDGGRYDPATDTWSPVATLGQPSARVDHTAVWTGSRMVVWGGYGYSGLDLTSLDTGGLYDPATNTWVGSTTPTNAPSARSRHSAIWTGSRMIVWGGAAAEISTNTGKSYDPVGNTWGNVATMNAPSARSGHQAIWTGNRMIIWGGGFNTGGSYNPANDKWAPTSTANAPSARSGNTAIWTGSTIIVWGGLPTAGGVSVNTGGRYDPAGNAWTPTSTMGEVTARIHHTAVWTGNEMIIWGGAEQNLRVNTGGRYNPVSDSWTPTTVSGAPAARAVHVAVWTDNQMVVWGGADNGGVLLQSGGRYNPVLNAWSPMTSLNPPPGTEYASVVWTGTEMIVWGGYGASTGGRYNPATDSWIATSPGPTDRYFHSAVWTGSRMIVWGGGYDTGALYDPGSNSWTPTSTVNAPSARIAQSGVWTGNRMIIWGGYSVPDGVDVSTGAKYDPATDTWAPISSVGAPEARELHSAVWAGNRMVIWGGFAPGSVPLNTGGVYDPSTNSWTPTTLLHAPSPRARHTAIPAGNLMIVWGGHPQHSSPYNMLSTGGRYAPTGFDQDDDGFTTCAGDCDDANPAVYPGAPEPCDGLDNNCNGTVDEIVDADEDGITNCGGDCNDSNPAVHPGAAEVCNGVDDDCDASIDEGMPDSDGDGFDACADCNDSNPAVHPGVVETCDGVDQNCNGVFDEGFPDQDTDGSADCVDCQDLDPSIHPGAAEACNQLDDNCNELVDEGFDLDGDGFTVCNADCNDADPGAWEMPVEVFDLTMTSVMPADPSWVDLGPFLGPATVYDLVSGPLSTTAGLSLPSASCLQIGGPSSYQDFRPTPPPGEGFWYLARARNSCGVGTYGFPTIGPERVISACP